MFSFQHFLCIFLVNVFSGLFIVCLTSSGFPPLCWILSPLSQGESIQLCSFYIFITSNGDTFEMLTKDSVCILEPAWMKEWTPEHNSHSMNSGGVKGYKTGLSETKGDHLHSTPETIFEQRSRLPSPSITCDSRSRNHYDNQPLIWAFQHLNIQWKYSDHFQLCVWTLSVY